MIQTLDWRYINGEEPYPGEAASSRSFQLNLFRRAAIVVVGALPFIMPAPAVAVDNPTPKIRSQANPPPKEETQTTRGSEFDGHQYELAVDGRSFHIINEAPNLSVKTTTLTSGAYKEHDGIIEKNVSATVPGPGLPSLIEVHAVQKRMPNGTWDMEISRIEVKTSEKMPASDAHGYEEYLSAREKRFSDAAKDALDLAEPIFRAMQQPKPKKHNRTWAIVKSVGHSVAEFGLTPVRIAALPYLVPHRIHADQETLNRVLEPIESQKNTVIPIKPLEPAEMQRAIEIAFNGGKPLPKANAPIDADLITAPAPYVLPAQPLPAELIASLTTVPQGNRLPLLAAALKEPPPPGVLAVGLDGKPVPSQPRRTSKLLSSRNTAPPSNARGASLPTARQTATNTQRPAPVETAQSSRVAANNNVQPSTAAAANPVSSKTSTLAGLGGVLAACLPIAGIVWLRLRSNRRMLPAGTEATATGSAPPRPPRRHIIMRRSHRLAANENKPSAARMVLHWAKQHAPAFLTGAATGAGTKIAVTLGAKFGLAALAATHPSFTHAVAQHPVAAGIIAAMALGSAAGGMSKLVVNRFFGKEKEWSLKAFRNGAVSGAIFSLGGAFGYHALGWIGHKFPHFSELVQSAYHHVSGWVSRHIHVGSAPHAASQNAVQAPAAAAPATTSDLPHVAPATDTRLGSAHSSTGPSHILDPQTIDVASTLAPADVQSLIGPEQLHQLPLDVQALAQSTKPEDLIHFCKEASFHILRPPGHLPNDTTYQVARRLMRTGIEAAKNHSGDATTVKQLVRDMGIVDKSLKHASHAAGRVVSGFWTRITPAPG